MSASISELQAQLRALQAQIEEVGALISDAVEGRDTADAESLRLSEVVGCQCLGRAPERGACHPCRLAGHLSRVLLPDVTSADARQTEIFAVKCASCGARIRFLEMAGTGRSMPVEAEPVPVIVETRAGSFYKASGYLPHWPACPGADEHRKAHT